jgi:hypothetical protein
MTKENQKAIKDLLYLCYVEESITEVECFQMINTLETDLDNDQINIIMMDCNLWNITEKKIGLILDLYLYEWFTSEEQKAQDLRDANQLQQDYITGNY